LLTFSENPESKTEHCSDVHNGGHIVGTDILAVRLRPI